MQTSIPRPKKAQYRHYRTPTIIQMEASECGAAALCMVLGYYGSYPPLEEIRTFCAVSRDGVNAYNVLRAAQEYGLQGDGYRCEIEELYEAPLPLIAFWGFNHFVVIEGFSRKHVHINDPASGPRNISYEELNQAFTGVILTFAAVKNFRKIPPQSTSWTRVWDRLKLFRLPILFSLLVGMLAIIPTLTLAALSKAFIDNVLMARFSSWEWGIMAGMSLLVVGGTLIQFLQNWISTRFSLQLSTLLSSQFMWHILHLPLLFIIRRYGGEIASRLGLNQAVADTFIEQVLGTAINIFFAIAFAVVMFFYDIPITLIGIVLVFANLFAMITLFRSRADAYANYRQIQGRLASLTVSGLENIESIKAINGEYQFLGRYGGLYTKSLNTLQQMARSDVMLGTIAPFFSSIGFLTVLFLGAWRIIQGHMTVGDFFALQILFKNFTDPVLSLVSLNPTLQLLNINTVRLDDVLSHPRETLIPEVADNDSDQKKTTGQLKGNIQVSGVSFGFNPLSDPLLKNIEFTLPPGSFTALVGPSGCGKSTLVKLIGRILKPWQGEIFFDGISYLAFSSKTLAHSIAIVEQVPMLFTDTVERNISLLDPSIDKQVLIQAAKDACIHDEILQRPGGYQLLLEKQGLNFSGGQRQRIEIACALSRQPSFIILDEATSAIDSITEKIIFQNIRQRKCTCLVITHRLHAIQDCDTILVMDQGCIVQKGTHSDLIRMPGLYQSLAQAENIEACIYDK